jgi:hypothetical protein
MFNLKKDYNSLKIIDGALSQIDHSDINLIPGEVTHVQLI